jgi:hypothetical protein
VNAILQVSQDLHVTTKLSSDASRAAEQSRIDSHEKTDIRKFVDDQFQPHRRDPLAPRIEPPPTAGTLGN